MISSSPSLRPSLHWLASLLGWLALSGSAFAGAALPPPADHPVDFAREIKPLFEAACIKCHARGKEKGGFSIETRASFLKGGDNGVDAIIGQSSESPVVEMVAGVDPDNVMPKKGTKWTPAQVGLLRAWIDQGAAWPEAITFAKPEPQNLLPRTADLPAGPQEHPIDRVLAGYFTAPPSPVVDDHTFARRAYLDTIGLLPTPEQLAAFLADSAPDKRARLVHRLLSDDRGYADHWLTFWNDLLRNDYRGTGFIDGGRKQISEWLYNALLTNKPYGQFVSELVNPNDQSLGFTAGIIWRGTVPAVMTPPMQAAQSVSQVFLGINLKCASCHDSFVNDWSLADAYGMAALYSEKELELVHCDKPTGKKAAVRFLYPQLGAIESGSSRSERLQRLAAVLTGPQDGRLSRTLVNRLWARLFGHGLVEPTDDMDQPAWSPALLDWLAEDFVANGLDIRHALETIMTSNAYALPAQEGPRPEEKFVFRGPITRRLSAEQFSDAVAQLTGTWAALPATLEFDFTGGADTGAFALPRWIWTDEPLALASERHAAALAVESTAAAAAQAVEARKLLNARDPKAAAARQAAQKAAEDAAALAKWAVAPPVEGRHKVVFRQRFTLAEAPAVAWATLAASQGMEVQVNGKVVKSKMADGWRNGRIRLFDFAPHLRAGENWVAVSIDSHTEKAMSDTERKQFPASADHLNARPGFAFYLRARMAKGNTEVISDESWRVRRFPEGKWNELAYDDRDWSKATLLPEGQEPIDEGPGLEPLRRQDFANIAVPLGPALRAACSTAALAGRIRAAMLFADPLQAALERPNREIVTPSRSGLATTLQALELTNGATLTNALATAARAIPGTSESIERLYLAALSRPPAEGEKHAAAGLFGEPLSPEDVTDLLWALIMLPEFQLIN